MDLAVIGLGYVGLPLAVEAAGAGLSVLGFDVDEAKVAGLGAGVSHVEDIPDDRVRAALASGLAVSADPALLADAEAIVIAVPTPMADHSPDLGAVEAAGRTIGAHLRSGQLVVLESTSYPGTTEEVLAPILENVSGLRAGVDFDLAFSPERIDPGNPTYGLKNTPKVVGGMTPGATARAAALYGRFCDTVVEVSGTREAELSKLIENTYRQINIALVNEMAIFCHDMGIDLWESIDAAATKPFGFQAFRPGPGVGGHCIPIDPNYLSHRVSKLGYPFRFVELAQEINDRMPNYVVERVMRLLNDRGQTVSGTRVVLAGVAYKKDVGDIRETPASEVVRNLRRLGADLSYLDPHVEAFDVDDQPVRRVTRIGDVDLVILLTDHADFDLEAMAAASPLVFDTRGVMSGDNVFRL